MNTNKISIWHRHDVMEHQHSIDFYFVVSSILLHLSFLKTEPNWLNSNHRLDYVGERNGTCSEYKTISFKGNRPSAWWRHFTTMTRFLQGFAFLCKLELLLFIKSSLGLPNFKSERQNEKHSGRNSKMTPSCKWPIWIRTESFPWPRFSPVSEESFEWSHHRVSPTDSKVKTSY